MIAVLRKLGTLEWRGRTAIGPALRHFTMVALRVWRRCVASAVGRALTASLLLHAGLAAWAALSIFQTGGALREAQLRSDWSDPESGRVELPVEIAPVMPQIEPVTSGGSTGSLLTDLAPNPNVADPLQSPTLSAWDVFDCIVPESADRSVALPGGVRRRRRVAAARLSTNGSTGTPLSSTISSTYV